MYPPGETIPELQDYENNFEISKNYALIISNFNRYNVRPILGKVSSEQYGQRNCTISPDGSITCEISEIELLIDF